MVELVSLRLTANGYEVLKAADGQAAIDLVYKEKPDLIILDLMIPKLDGYKVCRLLKSDSNYQDIPIIVFSAKVQDKEKEIIQEVGADDYITKPFDPEIMLAKINSLIK